MEAQELYAGVLQNYVALKYPNHPQMFARILQRLADIRWDVIVKCLEFAFILMAIAWFRKV